MLKKPAKVCVMPQVVGLKLKQSLEYVDCCSIVSHAIPVLKIKKQTQELHQSTDTHKVDPKLE